MQERTQDWYHYDRPYSILTKLHTSSREMTTLIKLNALEEKVPRHSEFISVVGSPAISDVLLSVSEDLDMSRFAPILIPLHAALARSTSHDADSKSRYASYNSNPQKRLRTVDGSESTAGNNQTILAFVKNTS